MMIIVVVIVVGRWLHIDVDLDVLEVVAVLLAHGHEAVSLIVTVRVGDIVGVVVVLDSGGGMMVCIGVGGHGDVDVPWALAAPLTI